MKHVQAYLSASKDRGSSFHPCGGPVQLVQASFCPGNTLQRRFNRRGGAVKHVQDCLSTRNDQESSFHPCRSPLRFMLACLIARKDRESSFHHCGGPVRLVLACSCQVNGRWRLGSMTTAGASSPDTLNG